MHDGARGHTANVTNQWVLAELDINVIDWPAVCSDQTTVENIWRMRTQCVYDNRFQSQTKECLRNTIVEACNEIYLTELEILNKSIPRRCAVVFASSGCTIDY